MNAHTSVASDRIAAPIDHSPLGPEGLPMAPAEIHARAIRADGWTPARQRTFLEALSEGHTVEAACRIVGLSAASAYAFRRRKGGEAFAAGWRAACLLARDTLADVLMARAIDGQIETLTRADGETVTRHRFDNRLATAMLTRLDRLAELPAPTGHPADAADPLVAGRAVAGDFAAFLEDVVEAEGDAGAVRDFIEAAEALRNPQLPQLSEDEDDDEADAEDEEDGDDGNAAAAEGEDAEDPVWWHDQRAMWVTSLPAPPDFTGWVREDYPNDPCYTRELTDAELAHVEKLQAQRRAEARTACLDQRRYWFGDEE